MEAPTTILLQLRAELTRLQAERLEADEVLNAAQPGTQEYGAARNRRQQVGLAVHQAQERLSAAVLAGTRGSQPMLF